MHLFILNQKFERVHEVDVFQEFMWTDRYREYGDFSIVDAPTVRLLSFAHQDWYVWFDRSEHLMVIDEVKIETDPKDGPKLTVSGKSLEQFILENKRILHQTILEGNVQTEIRRLLIENAMGPEDPDRKVDNFLFDMSTDARITELTMEALQMRGETLYEVIVYLCDAHNMGFRIVLNDSNQFVFQLYMGKDRSYAQMENAYVVFSHGYENLLNSNYLESNHPLRNVCYVAGEGEGAEQIIVQAGAGKGLARRETWLESTISSTVSVENEDGEMVEETLPEDEYKGQLVEEGNAELLDHKAVEVFEGEVGTTQFLYGSNFFMGDICQMANEYGKEARIRVEEVIYSVNASGTTTVPTFVAITE